MVVIPASTASSLAFRTSTRARQSCRSACSFPLYSELLPSSSIEPILAVHRAVIPTLQGNNALKMVTRLVRGFGPSGPALPVPSPDRGYRGWSTSRRTPLPNPDVRTLAQRDESTPGQRSPSDTPPDIDPTSPTWPPSQGWLLQLGELAGKLVGYPFAKKPPEGQRIRHHDPAGGTPFSWRLPR